MIVGLLSMAAAPSSALVLKGSTIPDSSGTINLNIPVPLYRSGILDVSFGLSSQPLNPTIYFLSEYKEYYEDYDPKTGKFISSNEIEFIDGYDFAGLFNPLTNTYSRSLDVQTGREASQYQNDVKVKYSVSTVKLSFFARYQSETPIEWMLDLSGPSSVPEPASWTMLIVGFGAIGLSLRRRRNNFTSCHV
ncbi:PEPxxWA-CTERM sorting domain-containing protein [Sandarakinorhabdus glacialis]|uniref:PEPxxWA-CTERM sorting domain-containing protein n=1 Tax=Sandarakinorhabdus glacialis TaxID=1614636 RepID=UPI001FB0F4E4|nr:PEPxxWA-CTERM sorting domain-containing protein [Polymorphobacter glacialis]